MKYLLALALLLLASCRGHGLAPDHFHAFVGTGDTDSSGYTGLRPNSSSSETTTFTLGWTWDLNRKADEDHQRREEIYLASIAARPEPPSAEVSSSAQPETKAAEPETKTAQPETEAKEPETKAAQEQPKEKILGMPPWVAKLTLWCTVAGAVMGVLAKMGKLPWLRDSSSTPDDVGEHEV
jgi:hypothetical protein